jgi:signal transduction histidine kinase
MSLPLEETPDQLRRDLQRLRKVGGTLIITALMVQFWGHWRVVAILAVVVPLIIFLNTFFVERVTRRFGMSVGETVRSSVNVLNFAIIGPTTEWSLVVWLYLPFNTLWFDSEDRWARLRVVAYLLTVDAMALLSGCKPLLPMTFTLLAGITALVTDRRATLHRAMLHEVLAQRERLQQAHQRAMAQEKLSSLGMMAAGVAHEINNPMSFVTSNVRSLYKELQQQRELPEPLQEYVTEVLPETLDGIRRVNAIVADLRRFSRGDPETAHEYDLNEEARAALRIAQGQLSHCEVEVELGEVGRLVGRPTQIVQVLVNLLVNAGQATAPGGRVRLSTRLEGDQVRLEVRDMGSGMSPEVLSRLFQPFFTTKPHGEGTGLGLAVVHGIVTAHGGRITVESQPGQGSCFTVYLPRVMPARESPPGGHERR